MRSLLLSTAFFFLSLAVFAQGPAKMAYGLGVTYFMPDNGSSFGGFGSSAGGFDGMNLFASLNVDMPIWDNIYVRLGTDAHYLRAITTNKTTNLAGVSPHFGLGSVKPLKNGQLRYGLTMGLSLMRTWDRDSIGSTPINSGFLGGSIGIPAGISIRYEIPKDERTYYIGADFRYFMFDDGLDGIGAGNRVGYDDQMLTFSIGLVNKKTYRSKKLASLQLEANKVSAIPQLEEKLNQAKEENAIIQDDLEVAHFKAAEANRKLDSLALVSVKIQEQVSTVQDVVKSKDVPLPALPSGSYVVVLGSFENKSLAKKYSAALDYDMPANVIKARNNFYRVFLGPFNSFAKAKDALDGVSGKAWISMGN